MKNHTLYRSSPARRAIHSRSAGRKKAPQVPGRLLLWLLGPLLLLAPLAGTLHAQFDLGADVVSRYIWRGTDFGNAASIQPYVSYGLGNLEIGAWSSWALTSSQANENDLYLTYSLGPVGLTLTDYYFPVQTGQSDFFDYNSDTGSHILEASGLVGSDDLALLVAYNFSGDPDHSAYVEGNYAFYSNEDISAGLSIGAGNQVYVTEASGNWNIVNLALNVTRDRYMVSYILNPEADISWMVLGISF